MATRKLIIEVVRFHLYQPDTLVFSGWFHPDYKESCQLGAFYNGKELPVELSYRKGAEVRQRHLNEEVEVNEEWTGIVHLPKDWRSQGDFECYCLTGDEKEKVYTLGNKKLRKIDKQVEYYIETVSVADQKLEVAGWAVGAGCVDIQIIDGKGKAYPAKVERYPRRDVSNVFKEVEGDMQPGFKVVLDMKSQNVAQQKLEATKLRIVLKDNKKKSVYKVNFNDDAERKAAFTMRLIEKGFHYMMVNGIPATTRKLYRKIMKKATYNYDDWRARYEVKEAELATQRATTFPVSYKCSIVIPLYMTNPRFLREMVDSIRNQTYTNWELCMADGSGANSPLTGILEEYAKKDARIHYNTLENNLGIAGNTNAALEMATGEIIVLADHDDIMPANALFELMQAWNQDTSIDVIYSDEDKISMDGKKYFEPHFKSDYNVDLLRSMNYICHLFAFRKEILAKVGGFRQEYDGAQDYDFILRCCEEAGKIHHIPKILYHWRCHIDSTAANPESKRYAFEAGKRAVQAHYERVGIPAKVEHSEFYGMYRTIYEWSEEPLVSILIPNKDHIDDLDKCLKSIEKSDYKNYEVIVIENNSTEPETFAYYKQIESGQIHVVYYEGEFNFSRVNNFGAKSAKGDYFLLLNNDTEMIHENCIRELLGYCMREDVGAVGARLYYEDDTIQHAGVVLGFGGIAGHTFIGKSRYDTGYFGRIICAQDYSAVTAACTMTKRSTFEKVNGLSEELRVAFNDIDYCMKVRSLGQLVVYNPYAELYHYESKSRGLEDTPEKVERFNGEVDMFIQKWEKELAAGDPYYNKNLTLDNSDFSLRK